MANPWFRMYAEFANDPKIQMMSEAMQRRYVMLMCFRCSNVTVTLHETEIAFALRITETELAETKALFVAKGFIDDQWDLLNWDKRQFSSDTSAPRVARHRAKKLTECNADVTLQKRPCNALDTDTDKKYIAPIPANLLKDYLKVRKAKRAGELTETAFKGIESQALKAGITAIQAIEICCRKGWAGFDATWDHGVKASKPKGLAL
jgi:hypothetical protein